MISNVELLENEFRAVLSSIGDGVIVTSAEEDIIYANGNSEEIVQISVDEMIGKNVQDVLDIRTQKGKDVHLPVGMIVQTGKRLSSEEHVFLHSTTGDITPLSYVLAPIKDSEDIVIGTVLTIRDMTREYEIGKMKSEFVSIVSHQLRTPLSAIKWYLETLIDNPKKEPVSEHQLEFLEQAFQSNERVISLVNDLLNVSRLESGRMKMNIEPTDLTKDFSIVLEEVELFAHANNVQLSCNFIDSTLPTVDVDAEKIRQVIQNLISNAIKYSSKKSTVTISVEEQTDRLVFSVADEGMGIAEEDQERLFEAFFRADAAVSSQTEGSGLGLYICKKILELNGGDIWVDSAVGKGSTFFFSVPRSKKT